MAKTGQAAAGTQHPELGMDSPGPKATIPAQGFLSMWPRGKFAQSSPVS